MSTSSPEILRPAAEAMSSATRSAKTFTDRASAGIRNGVSQTREQLTDTRDALAQTVKAAAQVPAPVAGRVTGLAQGVRQRPAPALALAFAIFALLLLRRFLSKTTE
jgi:hypothetical protein